MDNATRRIMRESAYVRLQLRNSTACRDGKYGEEFHAAIKHWAAVRDYISHRFSREQYA